MHNDLPKLYSVSIFEYFFHFTFGTKEAEVEVDIMMIHQSYQQREITYNNGGEK